MSTFRFRGGSGESYPYSLMPWQESSSLTREGGIFLFAKGSEDAPIPVFLEEADDIRAAVAASLAQRDSAQSVHGAHLLFIRAEQDRERRQREKLDLVATHQPVMNVATAHEE